MTFGPKWFSDQSRPEAVRARAQMERDHKKLFAQPSSEWDNRWMDLAELVASWSKDRSRKVGCVIVGERNVLVSLGWNGFPRGIDDEADERHERPAKYLWTEHAERNAIYNAAAKGVSTLGCTMYLPWYPCADCARAIIQAGIGRLVAVMPDWDDPRYRDDFKVVEEMFSDAVLKRTLLTDRKAPVRG